MIHLGKGLLTLAPHRADRNLVSNVALSSLATFALICSDLKGSILGNSHYLIYTLVPAMRPRFVVTLEQEKSAGKVAGKEAGKEAEEAVFRLQSVPITCHVGQAVDVVGQAGKPKTITGFQTHNTPVLLGVGERVALSTEKYLSTAPILEGFVVVKENPDFEE